MIFQSHTTDRETETPRGFLASKWQSWHFNPHQFDSLRYVFFFLSGQQVKWSTFSLLAVSYQELEKESSPAAWAQYLSHVVYMWPPLKLTRILTLMQAHSLLMSMVSKMHFFFKNNNYVICERKCQFLEIVCVLLRMTSISCLLRRVLGRAEWWFSYPDIEEAEILRGNGVIRVLWFLW